MKHFTTFILILIAALCCAMSVAAADEHFTCGSDPAMLSNKEYDNLYLDVEGCGEDVVLEKVTVTGNLVYNGGKDMSDHHLTIKKSSIQNFFMPCESSHSCSLNIKNKSLFSSGIYNLIVMPSGNEKGKIYINGSYGELARMNFVTDKITDDYSDILYNGFETFEPTKVFIPAGLPDNLSSRGVVEIELNNINVEQFSVVNKSQSAVASVSMNQNVTIDIMSAFTPSLKLYSYERKDGTDKLPKIQAFIGVTDGAEMELSMDFVQIYIAHFLGNNNSGSKLKLKVGYEKHINSYAPSIVNLFLFGSNMDILGYFSPKRDLKNVRRIIITEQPQDYHLNASMALMTEFLEKYGDTYFKHYKSSAPISRYEGYLDMITWSKYQFSAVSLFSELSEKYARNYPDSSTNWRPHINLSYANIGKAICAQSIAEKISAISMFTFVTDSYMTLHGQPARYVMQDGLTASLAEDPIYGGMDSIDWLPGCHTYAYDPRTGRIVAID